MKSILSSLLCAISLVTFSQDSKPKTKKLSVVINYGLNANFFVRRYDELGGPSNKTLFNNKRLIGTIGGIDVKYQVGKKSNVGLGYARSVNKRSISYKGAFNSISLQIRDFQITHTNMFYQLFYERYILKRTNDLSGQVGAFYLRSNQQEVDLLNFVNTISFDERNYKNSNLEEGGLFFGLQYSTHIDTKVELGLKSRIYYLLSTSSLEAITLTPCITVYF